MAERRELTECPGAELRELYHLERLTTLLDSAPLAATRKQFLGIDYLEDPAQKVADLREQLLAGQARIEGLQTGGDSYCYFMLYHFDLQRSVAQNVTLIRKGQFPLYDVQVRVVHLSEKSNRTLLERSWGEMNAPADFIFATWRLEPSVYYRIFFHARNGAWHQDLILRRSESAQCWLAATKVVAPNGRDVRLLEIDHEFEAEFGAPTWRS